MSILVETLDASDSNNDSFFLLENSESFGVAIPKVNKKE